VGGELMKIEYDLFIVEDMVNHPHYKEMTPKQGFESELSAVLHIVFDNQHQMTVSLDSSPFHYVTTDVSDFDYDSVHAKITDILDSTPSSLEPFDWAENVIDKLRDKINTPVSTVEFADMNISAKQLLEIEIEATGEIDPRNIQLVDEATKRIVVVDEEPFCWIISQEVQYPPEAGETVPEYQTLYISYEALSVAERATAIEEYGMTETDFWSTYSLCYGMQLCCELAFQWT
jgi:hypothetical protein